MSVLPNKIAFLDVETTGARATYDRIIEIGILRVEQGQLIDSYQTLVNPQCSIPPEITMITGITSADIENAPSFYEIKDRVLELLDDCVLAAHNVRFDYGFLKNEFKRLEHSFSTKHFCTVKLSRQLFPQFTHHNLDAIIQRFQFDCPSRHRAFDDAKVLWDFYQTVQQQFEAQVLEEAFSIVTKRPSLPIHLPPETFDTLPEVPGVYIFYGDAGAPLYVGKSINIRDRVLSHFSSDHSSNTEMKIAQLIRSIDTIQTSGELGALLLEASLVKKMQPLFNRQLRHARKLTVLKKYQDQTGYLRIAMDTLDRINPLELDQLVGIFRSQQQAKTFLISLAKDFELCERMLNVEHTKGECFGYRLGRCHGACAQKEIPVKYNLRFIEATSKHKIRSWPFQGPILIEEENPLEHSREGFIIDHWCHIASLDLQSESPKLTPNERVFDLDAYKILDRYLRSGKHSKNIKMLTETDLARFSYPVI